MAPRASYGIGLANALHGYQQGVAWKQQQDEIARQRQQRDAFDAANREGMGVIEKAKQRWAESGAPGQFRPDDGLMFEVAETRGMALAKAGLWDQFMQNQAQVAPMRLKARQSALQEYDMSGDADKFVRSIYPTMQGKRIVGSEQVQGAEAVQGLAAIPTRTTFKFDDGSTETFTNEQVRQLYGRVKASLVDPAASAKNEALLGMERIKAEIEAGKQAEIARMRGEQARETEGVKNANALGQEQVKQQGRLDLAAANNAAALVRSKSGGGGAGEPADVKLAKAAMDAGLFTDMKEALTWATRTKDASPEKVRADLYGKALAAKYGDAAEARQVTEEAMNYLFPRAGSPAARSTGLKPYSDADVAATAKKHGITEDEVRRRLQGSAPRAALAASPAQAPMAPAANSERAVAPAVQQRRDIEAGQILIQEAGGAQHAPALLRRLQAAAEQAPHAEGRAVYLQQIRALQAALGASQPVRAAAPAVGLAAVRPASPATTVSSPTPDETPQAEALDTARAATRQARQRLQGFGSRQKAADPRGYAEAKSALDAAERELSKAEARYRASLGEGAAAFGQYRLR